MYLSLRSTHLTITQVIAQIYRSGKITRLEKSYFLQAMVGDEPLSQDEQTQVRNVFDRLQMGLLHVLD